jgi:nitric oxide dioxygenase
MLTQQHIDTVKATIPLLASAGVAITDHFYRRLFTHHPELKNIFNLSHQHSGAQKVALFDAIAAYAHHIENPAALKSAIERIAQKHTGFNVQPEHYQVVGHHLIETLRELAGEAFTPEVEEAWSEAYGVLADVFIQREAAIYQEHATHKGGWEGLRRFIVQEKRVESSLITSFVLVPEDGQAVLDYQAGQYLSISVQPSHSPYTEIRQYSLSDAPNARSYRISVRREDRGNGAPAGVVSCYLHDEIKEGDVIEAYAPAGDFVFKASSKPLVLISAGVGLTPMQSILESLAQKKTAETDSANGAPIYYLHATESQDTHAFKARTEALKGNLALTTYTWYQRAQNQTSEYRFEGEMTLSDAPNLPLQQAEIYLCGPIRFMKAVYQQLKAHGVDDSQIHYELFGPHQSLEA